MFEVKHILFVPKWLIWSSSSTEGTLVLLTTTTWNIFFHSMSAAIFQFGNLLLQLHEEALWKAQTSVNNLV